jgi:hypothetical protein
MRRTGTRRHSSSSRGMRRPTLRLRPRPRLPHQGDPLRLREQRQSSRPTKRSELGSPTVRRHRHHPRPTTLRSVSLLGPRSSKLTKATRRVWGVVTPTEHHGSKASTPTCLDLTKVWHLTASMYIATSRQTLVGQTRLHHLRRGPHGRARHWQHRKGHTQNRCGHSSLVRSMTMLRTLKVIALEHLTHLSAESAPTLAVI